MVSTFKMSAKLKELPWEGRRKGEEGEEEEEAWVVFRTAKKEKDN